MILDALVDRVAFPQGNAIGNVIAYSSGSEQCFITTAAVSFGWVFAITDLSSSSARSFQSRFDLSPDSLYHLFLSSLLDFLDD